MARCMSIDSCSSSSCTTSTLSSQGDGQGQTQHYKHSCKGRPMSPQSTPLRAFPHTGIATSLPKLNGGRRASQHASSNASLADLHAHVVTSASSGSSRHSTNNSSFGELPPLQLEVLGSKRARAAGPATSPRACGQPLSATQRAQPMRHAAPMRSVSLPQLRKPSDPVAASVHGVQQAPSWIPAQPGADSVGEMWSSDTRSVTKLQRAVSTRDSTLFSPVLMCHGLSLKGQPAAGHKRLLCPPVM